MRRQQDRDRTILGQFVASAILDETLAQFRATGLSLVDYVLRKELADDEQFADILSKHYVLPRVAIKPHEIEPNVHHLIPSGFARLFHIVPLAPFAIATEDPADQQAMLLLEACFPGRHWRIFVASRSWLQEAIDFIYGPGSKLSASRPDADWRRSLRLDLLLDPAPICHGPAYIPRT